MTLAYQEQLKELRLLSQLKRRFRGNIQRAVMEGKHGIMPTMGILEAHSHGFDFWLCHLLGVFTSLSVHFLFGKMEIITEL